MDTPADLLSLHTRRTLWASVLDSLEGDEERAGRISMIVDHFDRRIAVLEPLASADLSTATALASLDAAVGRVLDTLSADPVAQQMLRESGRLEAFRRSLEDLADHTGRII